MAQIAKRNNTNFVDLTDTDTVNRSVFRLKNLVKGKSTLANTPIIRLKVNNMYCDFLIDTGSSVSVLNDETFKRLQSNDSKLVVTKLSNSTNSLKAVNDTSIKIEGLVTLPVSIISNEMSHEFVICDLSLNILGYDFMSKYDLIFIPDQDQVTFYQKVARVPILKGIEDMQSANVRNQLSTGETSQNRLGYLSSRTIRVNDTNNNATKPKSQKRVTFDLIPRGPSPRFSNQNTCYSRRPVVPILESSRIRSLRSDKEKIVPLMGETDDYVNKKSLTVLQKIFEMKSKHTVKEENKPEFSREVYKMKDQINMNRENDIAALKKKYPSVFSGKLDFSKGEEVPVEHVIKTEGQYRAPYVYAPAMAYHQQIKQRIEEMQQQGVIQPSSSAYAAPIVVRPKKDGRLRLCVDYRALNEVTIPDKYVLPRIDDIISSIRGNVFSSLDLKEGFWQVPVHPDTRPLTAMATPWGLYEYCRMPFGLKNAPPTFQRLMNEVLRGLDKVRVYLDDIVVYTDTYEEHIMVLDSVFQRLHKYGLIINEQKTSLFTQTLHYLGLEFSPYGYKPLEVILPKLDKIPPPKTKRDIQKFMGTINYYRNHVPALAEHAAPLYELLKKNKRFSWTNVEQEAFDMLKHLCQERIHLTPLRDEGEIELFTDASEVACGAALLQDGKVVEFYSRRFSDVETRYSATDRECLAMVRALLHFRRFLYGHTFTVHTDHKPLTYFMSTTPKTERRAKWLTHIQDLDFKIKYIKGEDNVLADLLSRPPDVQKGSLEEFHKALEGVNATFLESLDDEVRHAQTPEFLEAIREKVKVIRFVQNIAYVEIGANLCLIVPPAFQETILKKVHNMGHFGRKRTYALLRKKYYWPGMSVDTGRIVRECESCQVNKLTRPQKREYEKFPITSRFKTVHTDIVGPIRTTASGKRYIMTIMDRFSRWMEAVPLRSMEAETIAKAFYETWVCRYGLPDYLISDQGTNFESRLFNEMLSRFGTVRNHTTAFHPQANGLIERSHRTIKEILRNLGAMTKQWDELLPSVLLALRNAISNTGVSPSLVVFGEHLAIPSIIVESQRTYPEGQMTEFVAKLQEDLLFMREHLLQIDPTLSGPTDKVSPQFPHKYVWIKQPVLKSSLHPKYIGPYEVLEVKYPVIIIDRDGKRESISVDRLKPAFIPLRSEVEIEQAPPLVDLEKFPIHLTGPPVPMPRKLVEDSPQRTSMPETLRVDNNEGIVPQSNELIPSERWQVPVQRELQPEIELGTPITSSSPRRSALEDKSESLGSQILEPLPRTSIPSSSTSLLPTSGVNLEKLQFDERNMSENTLIPGQFFNENVSKSGNKLSDSSPYRNQLEGRYVTRFGRRVRKPDRYI